MSGGHHHGPAHGAERATLTKRAAMASVGMALFLTALKFWASWDTGSVAMLGSLAGGAFGFLLVIGLRAVSGLELFQTEQTGYPHVIVPAITAPMLFLHSPDDVVIPIAHGTA